MPASRSCGLLPDADDPPQGPSELNAFLEFCHTGFTSCVRPFQTLVRPGRKFIFGFAIARNTPEW